MNAEQLYYHLSLVLIPHIGDVHISILLEHFKDPKQVFHAKRKELERLNGIGSVRANAIKSFNQFDLVDRELKFIEKNDIRVLVKTHIDYPNKLREFQDAPHVLYFKGSTQFNDCNIVSVIGTRSPTSYGKERVIELMQHLREMKAMVVSGLAYGIDTIVHKEALRVNLPTLGVLGHGLDQIYPKLNRSLAIEMLQNGGLITEFMSKTKPDKQNFPLRNRIVSGIADAVIVVESGEKGGSLITANMANAYYKDVFAYPGRAIDSQSRGCNELIKSQRAMLINCGNDFLTFMNWQKISPKKSTVQSCLFHDLTQEEHTMLQLFNDGKTLSIDQIHVLSAMKPSQIPLVLLSLEMKGMIKILPGKIYAAAGH
jgi:DNA processing protein